MSFRIAVAGKGGVGKTTISALLVRALYERSNQLIMAVDADPNSNLGEKLGIKVERTIGDLREDLLKRSEEVASGGSKHEAVMYQLRLAMIEGREFDLVTMGRPEGRGCYCYINNLLRTFLDEVMSDYGYVVIDNEAGMEHLSRRTEEEVDHLFIVSDPAPRSLRTIGRILELIDELGGRIHNTHLILSRVQGSIEDMPEGTRKEIGDLKYSPECLIPYDETLVELDLQGKPLFEISSDAPSYKAVKEMLDRIGIFN